MSSVTGLLHNAALTNAHGAATVFRDRTRTWGEVADRVARVGGALRGLGVTGDACVSALGLNSDRYLELHFAVPWAGASFAPLNVRWAEPENAMALGDAAVSVLFVDDGFLDQARNLRESVPSLTTLVYLGDDPTPDDMLGYEDMVDASDPVADSDRRDDDLYLILYTSGTTAQSKGVELSHRNAVFTALAFKATIDLDRSSTHLHLLGLFHVGGAQPLWYITMVAGTHVLHEGFTPQAAMAAIVEHRVTNTVMVPTMINMVVHTPGFEDHDLSSVRTCVYGGSPMPATILARARELLPDWGFHQIYGQTESTGYATALTWADHTDAAGESADRLRSAGRPVPGMQVAIAAPEDGRPLPIGETGEILIRGDNVTRGYHHNPDATAAALVDGWIHTGDAGYLDGDGFLYIADRVKDMIITGGENVYSVDVERAIYDHPAVMECAVIGIPDAEWIEAVHAVVVLKAGQSLSADDLVAHCRTLIAGYKCPRSVEFVSGPLPTTPVGKIRKNVLRDPYWDGHDRRI